MHQISSFLDSGHFRSLRDSENFAQFLLRSSFGGRGEILIRIQNTVTQKTQYDVDENANFMTFKY